MTNTKPVSGTQLLMQLIPQEVRVPFNIPKPVIHIIFSIISIRIILFLLKELICCQIIIYFINDNQIISYMREFDV